MRSLPRSMSGTPAWGVTRTDETPDGVTSRRHSGHTATTPRTPVRVAARRWAQRARRWRRAERAALPSRRAAIASHGLHGSRGWAIRGAMLELVVGSKRSSSWSMRAWLALKHTQAPFTERLIQLDQSDTRERISQVNPAGRVPALLDDGLLVWDSLAICEYLAEKFPRAGLWPAAADARSQARSACAEMHSSFQGLRRVLPMRLVTTPLSSPTLTPEASADIRRITALWTHLRERWGQGGPYLFGHFTNADAFFAPVAVGRFRAYGLELTGAAQDYVRTLAAHPAVRAWVADAHREDGSDPRGPP